MTTPPAAELELHTPSTHKRWTVRVRGCDVETVTETVGKTPRSRVKTHESEAKAAKAASSAIRKKERAGYFPLGRAGFGPAVADDAVEPSDELVMVDCESVEPSPPQFDALAPDYGRKYRPGPGGTTLWLVIEGPEFTVHLGRGHFIEPVTPKLKARDDALVWLTVPIRADDAAMLIGVGPTLFELDASGAAQTVFAFDNTDNLLRHRFAYASDGSVLEVFDNELFHITEGRRTAVWKPSPFQGAGEGPILGFAPLVGGAFAVLQLDLITVAKLDGDSVTVSFRTQIRLGRALYSLLGGQVLVLMSDHAEREHTQFFAIGDAGLIPIGATTRRYPDGFDRYGGQWLRDPSFHGTVKPCRLFNLERAMKKALASGSER